MSRLRTVGVCLVAVAIAIAGCDNATSPSRSPSASGSAEVVALASPSVEVSASPSVSVVPSVSPSPSPTPSLAPTPSPTPTPAATPAPWKTYVSKLYRYQMNYPPEWIVTPGSSKLPDQYDRFGLPVVYAERDTVSGTVSVSLTVTHDVSYMKTHYKAKLVSNKTIKLAGGYNGKILTFTAVDDGRKVTVQEIIVARGSVAYFLWMWGDFERTAADQRLFKSFYTSWKPR